MMNVLKFGIVMMCLLFPVACATDSAEREESSAGTVQTENNDPFVTWSGGVPYKVITEEVLPDKLASEELGEVTMEVTLSELTEDNELKGQDGLSNYLKAGSLIFQLKDANTNEVILVEHEGQLYKAVRLDHEE
ncbi:hypothetical protein BK126_14130 [Paenibacillus sp. FSL H7-0326]|uniref:hypothetical protein n=1 Tax=Paenibacillus sp. FSL H7-0326 TaxID=1921144 RepID=UPI00096FC4EF|nr:hypothetical protein [Paenibacillus sp. FSL H7-0326]OMC68927.1 hypothetical protein BK126_14130 [Paenibacillus sp. FSL H7-0326]